MFAKEGGADPSGCLGRAIVYLISEADVVFWSGRKKQKTSPEPSDDPRTIIATALAEMLGIQMALAPVGEFEVSKIGVKKGRINRKAIGYVYGFVDGALQCRGEDIADAELGPPILYSVLRALFPGREDAYMKFLMEHEDDEIVLLGKMTGGQQFFPQTTAERQKIRADGLFALYH